MIATDDASPILSLSLLLIAPTGDAVEAARLQNEEQRCSSLFHTLS